jgi:hypothetical protein
MDISRFDELLQAARAQPEPQRLLFVFAGAEKPWRSAAARMEPASRSTAAAIRCC